MMGKIHEVTQVWTPSMDNELIKLWGNVQFKYIENRLGQNLDSVEKRANYLGINKGSKILNLNEMNMFSAEIENSNCDICAIVNAFKHIKISSIYRYINKIKELSGLKRKKEVKKMAYIRENLAKLWTDEENDILRSYITKWKSFDSSFQKEVCNKLPNHTWNAIRQRRYILDKPENKNIKTKITTPKPILKETEKIVSLDKPEQNGKKEIVTPVTVSKTIDNNKILIKLEIVLGE